MSDTQPPQNMFNSDSLDSKISRLLTLQELDHEGRILFRREMTKQMENLSERIDTQGEKIARNIQTTEFLLKDRDDSVVKLDSINKKLDYTNGAIAQAKRDIFELQEKMKRQEQKGVEIGHVIDFKNFVVKWCLNKYVAIAFFIFGVGTFKVATNAELRSLLIKIVGIG